MSDSIHWLNDVSSEWSHPMLTASVRGAVAIIVVWTLCRAFRRIPPFVQCWLWRLVYVTPLIALFWLAPVELPLLPALAESVPPPRPDERHSSVSFSTDDRPKASAAESGKTPIVPSAVGNPTDPSVQRSPVELQTDSHKPSPTSAVRLSVASWLLLFWTFGVLFCLLRLGRHWKEVRRLAEQLRLVTDESLASAIDRLSRLMGLRRRPALLALPANCLAPFLIGIRRPAIVLHSSMLTDCNDAELEMVLVHELAHLRRHDLVWNWLPRVVEILFFFHPLVWLARRQWHLTQEMATDELALSASGTSVEEYAHQLLSVVHKRPPNTTHGDLVVAMSRSFDTLKRRLTAMKTYRRHSLPNKLSVLALVTLIGIVGVVPWKATAREQPAHENSEVRASTKKNAANSLDRYEDPLPKGAIRRIGTIRLRNDGKVSGVAFSPDGKTLVSTSWSGGSYIRLWSVKTARPIRKLLPGSQFKGGNSKYEGTLAVAFSPDGKLMASGGSDGTVCLWNPETGKELFNARLSEEAVHGLAFAPDGKTFASAGSDGAIRIWDVATRKQVHTYRASDRIRSSHAVVFSPDGQWLASGGKRSIHIWNLKDSKRDMTIANAHVREIYSLHYLPDGKSLISCGMRYVSKGADRIGDRFANIHVWNTKTGRKTHTFKDGGKTMSYCSTALSKNGKTLASVHSDRIRIWDVTSKKVVRIIRDYLNPFGPRPHGLALSADGKTLAAHGPGRAVLLWDVNTGKRRHASSGSHESRVMSLAVSPDGSVVATGSDDRTVRVWSRATGKPVHVLRFGRGTLSQATAVAFSPDGRILVGGGYDKAKGSAVFVGTVTFWETKSGRRIHSTTAAGRVTAVAFAPDGKTIAIASGLADLTPNNKTAASITIRSVSNGKQLLQLDGHKATIRWMAFSEEGEQLVSVDESGILRRWNLAGKKPLKGFEIVGHNRPFLWSAAFSPDRKIVATGSSPGEAVILHEISTRKELRRLKTGRTRVLAFSPDGRILAAAVVGGWSNSKQAINTIQLWDVSTGKRIRRSPYGTRWVNTLSFTPDGKQLFSGLDDGTILVWDTSSAK